MILTDVMIRTSDQVLSMDSRLVDALNYSTKKNDKIPLVYRYLHNPNEEFIVDETNKIGNISNIRKTSKGYIGDVEIHDIIKLAINYQGTIDNLLVTYNTNIGRFEVNAFIIYDKIAKSECDKRKKDRLNNINRRLPRPGEVPFSSSYDNIDVKRACEALIEEYNKHMASQENKKN